MPGGDILVAEANAPERILGGGNAITNWIAGLLFSRAGAAVPSPDKLLLLRDADGDGVAEERHTLRSDLSSPSGIAWRDGKLYVANHDAVLRFDYAEGATTLAGPPTKLMDLPAAGNHWMRNLVLSEDGSKLYVAAFGSSRKWNVDGAGMHIFAVTLVCAFRNLKCSSIGWLAKPILPVTLMLRGFVWMPWNWMPWSSS